MNKVRLLELVRDPSKIQDKDLKQLVDLSKQHPYSQVLHILAAKAHHSLEHPNTDLFIQKAATYCWDRKLLKHIIEDTLDEIPMASVVEEPPVVEAETPPWEEELERDLDQEEPANFDWIEEQSLEENIHETSEELAANLEQESKEAAEGLEQEANSNFILEEPIDNLANTATESTEVEDETSLPSEIEDSLNESVALEASTEETEIANDLPAAKEEGSSADSMPSESPVQEHVDDLTPHESDAAEKDLLDLQIDAEIQSSGIHDELMQNLDRLRQSREEYQNPQEEEGEPLAEEPLARDAEAANALTENPEAPETKSRHQQIEIIDTFIKNSPVLSKPNLSADSEATSQKDLSKKSGTFSDELITEQLAKIMIKQGSTKEAIKIYKKLMVKIPKKKSYFASQIENLSKK